MSKVHIANFRDAPRFTVQALADMDLGDVMFIQDDGAGKRAAIPLTAVGQLKAGKYAVAMKFSADSEAVQESTANTDSGRDLGSRIVSISSGDFIVACMAGSILEYPQSELDISITPGTVDVGTYLAIDSATSKFATQASGDITSVSIAQVYQTFGTKILVEILPVPVTP